MSPPQKSNHQDQSLNGWQRRGYAVLRCSFPSHPAGSWQEGDRESDSKSSPGPVPRLLLITDIRPLACHFEDPRHSYKTAGVYATRKTISLRLSKHRFSSRPSYPDKIESKRSPQCLPRRWSIPSNRSARLTDTTPEVCSIEKSTTCPWLTHGQLPTR